MKQKYKGHEYEIKFCDPAKDWREHVGMFHIELAMGNSEFFSTYDQAKIKAHRIINTFIESVPQNDDGWIKAITNCMVWTGYEDCHIDKVMALDLLSKAKKYYTGGKK